jgi:hypothetical protein
MLLLASTIILQLDFQTWSGGPYGEIAFVLVLALLSVLLLVMARPAFTTQVRPPGPGVHAYPMDNYGWSTDSHAGTAGTDRVPRGVGP